MMPGPPSGRGRRSVRCTRPWGRHASESRREKRALKIAFLGTGYVGLTTGAALAWLGHDVVGVDVDERKVDLLRGGQSPIYEPWLDDLLHAVRDRLHFTTRYSEALVGADVVFIAVGTQGLPNGDCDLKHVRSAAQSIGENLGSGFTVVVNKSTVPVGCANWVDALVRESFEARNGSRPNGCFAVASNPEFLQEGTALHCTLYPDRVVVGSDHSQALERLQALYRPIVEQTFTAPEYLPRPEGLSSVPFVTSDLASAELIKYSANAFLALKISFINEIAQLAERTGADIDEVARGIGLDSRIGPRFLQAGIGWGGSCFGKDTAALVATAQEYGLSMPIVQAAREVNYRQRGRVVEKLLGELKILKGRTIGLLGLSFKPETDDLRDSPALDIARRLVERGCRVRAHDPQSLERARRDLAQQGLVYCDTPQEVAEEADALVLVTAWPEYRTLDWADLARRMHGPLLVDGRNFLDAQALRDQGFTVLGMGR